MTESVKNEFAAIHQPIQLKPVGVIRNQSRDASLGSALKTLDWRERAARMKAQSETISELVINSDLQGILDGIDGFSHLMVLFWAHLVPDEKRSTTRVHPMGSDEFPLVGIFATRSPVRPNSILVTVVRLIGRDGNVLKVSGLDALDGSPILDIKPYLPEPQDSEDFKMPDWMSKMQELFKQDRI